MKKIFLHAYDQINLGDDMFIHTIVNRYSNVKFYMWSDNQNKMIFKGLKNLTVLNKDSLVLSLFQNIRASFAARYKMWWEQRCDAVVYIGGSIFIEYDNWKQVLNWWEYEAENRSFFVLGANFGPYKSEEYQKKMLGIFNKMQDICFRDKFSYELFKECKPVRYAPDILFSYSIPKVPVKEKQLFVSVIDCANKDEGANRLSTHEKYYVQTMANLLKGYVKNGFSIVLASFSQIEGDENAIRKILEKMGNEHNNRISSLCYDGTNADKILMTLAESEYVIASRFHATIYAIVAGRPVLPIVYSDKTIHVLEDIGLGLSYKDIREEQEITYRESLDSMVTLSVSARENLKKNAQNHFYELDKRFFRKD